MKKFFVELKTRDFKTKHAWIVDPKSGMEAPLCSPERQLRYINRLMKQEYLGGKMCKDCRRKLISFKQQFPSITILEDL